MSIFRKLFNPLANKDYTPTRGIDLCDMGMGIWSKGTYRIFDMAGQDEYLPSHAFSLGHPHSVYLLVVNLANKDMEYHARHWLSAVSSCHNREKQRRPPVIFVASHADSVPCSCNGRKLSTNRKASTLLQKLRAEFYDKFNFIGDPIVMDCRNTISPEVRKLKTVLTTVLKETLAIVPDQPGACELIRRYLPRMIRLTRGMILDWPNFLRLVAQQVYNEEAMLSLPPEQDAIVQEAVDKLEESGELVCFKVGSMVYVVLDMQWILSLVNGRIFCPGQMAGTQPRLYVDNHGRTTVLHFSETFHDTGEEDLLLELFQRLDICIRFGLENENLLFPSLLSTETPPDCWCPPEDNVDVVTFGLCLQCHLPVGFSATFFPNLQVRFHHMWLLNYGHDISMWQGGFKLTQHLPHSRGAVEAVVILADDSFDTHVVVRSHKDDITAALALRHIILKQVYEVAQDVSRGSEVEQQVLVQKEILSHSTTEHQRISVAHFSIAELRLACIENRPAIAAGFTHRLSVPAEEVADLLLPYTTNQDAPPEESNFILLDETTIDVIEKALVEEDWELLAYHLGFSSHQVSQIVCEANNNVHQSAVGILLDKWQHHLTAGLPELIDALKACRFNRCTEAVEACRHRQDQQLCMFNARTAHLQEP